MHSKRGDMGGRRDERGDESRVNRWKRDVGLDTAYPLKRSRMAKLKETNRLRLVERCCPTWVLRYPPQETAKDTQSERRITCIAWPGALITYTTAWYKIQRTRVACLLPLHQCYCSVFHYSTAYDVSIRCNNGTKSRRVEGAYTKWSEHGRMRRGRRKRATQGRRAAVVEGRTRPG